MTQHHRPENNDYMNPAIRLARVAAGQGEPDGVTIGRRTLFTLTITPDGEEEGARENRSRTAIRHADTVPTDMCLLTWHVHAFYHSYWSCYFHPSSPSVIFRQPGKTARNTPKSPSRERLTHVTL